MHNPIARAARYLRREYPFLTTMAGAGTGIGAVIATLAVVASAGTLLMIPLVAVGMGAGMTLFAMPGGGELGRPSENTATVNGVKLVGNKRDVASIFMTQRLISGYTEKMQHLPELPARTTSKIAAHLLDIQDSLNRVRAYADPSGQALASFSFTRKMIDGRGEQVEQPVAVCNLPLATLLLPAPPQPAVLGAPAALASLPAPKADFASAVEAPQPETVENKAPVTKPGLKL